MRILLTVSVLSCLSAPYGYAETTNENAGEQSSLSHRSDRQSWIAIRLSGGKIINDGLVFACNTLDQYYKLTQFQAWGEGKAPKAGECQLLMNGAEVVLTQPNNPVCKEGVCEFRLDGWRNILSKPFYTYWGAVKPRSSTQAP